MCDLRNEVHKPGTKNVTILGVFRALLVTFNKI